MSFVHQKVFDPILSPAIVSYKIKSAINITIGRMNRLSEENAITL